MYETKWGNSFCEAEYSRQCSVGVVDVGGTFVVSLLPLVFSPWITDETPFVSARMDVFEMTVVVETAHSITDPLAGSLLVLLSIHETEQVGRRPLVLP